jgi:hypothetical protein
MPPFRPLKGRAYWAKRALGIAVFLGVIMLVADYYQWRLAQRMEVGAATLDEYLSNETIQTFVIFGEFTAYAIAGIFFLRWFHRAYANLRAFGTEGLPHGPGWAVGYWFVPIINLVRPAAVAADIWKASDPDGDPSSWKKRRTSALIVCWWLAFIFSGIGAWVGLRMWDSAANPAALTNAAFILLVADVLFIVAGILAIRFVGRTTARQEARASLLQPAIPGVAP